MNLNQVILRLKSRVSKKVFCVSYQRTGTTSVGKFLQDHDYGWAGWPADYNNEWSRKWYDGDFEGIFKSARFKYSNGFEDNPWWYPDFYRVLYHRFPGAKFIMFTRDPEAWFKSLSSYKDGEVLGHNRRHCRIYRREMEYYQLLKEGKFGDQTGNLSLKEKNEHPMKLGQEWKEHYIQLYLLHQMEVKDFFERHNPGALHVGQLEDPQKWEKLGDFLGLKVKDDYQSHENQSPNAK